MGWPQATESARRGCTCSAGGTRGTCCGTSAGVGVSSPPPPESSSPAPATPKTLPNNPEMILSVVGLKGFQQRAIAEAVVEHEIDLPEDIKPAHLRDTVNKLQKAKAQARGSKPPKPVKWDACNDFVKALRAWRANQRSLDG